MAAATADQYGLVELGAERKYGVEASEIIYDKTVVGDNGSGYAQALTAGDIFLGLNVSGKADNSTGSAGDVKVTCQTVAFMQESVTGIVGIADKGKKVYATDDNTYTISPGVPGASSCVGYVHAFVSSGKCIVRFDILAQFAGSLAIDGVAAVPAQLTTAGVVTYTPAQILAGLILRDPNGGTRADNTPTAVDMLAAIPNAVVGTKLEFVLQNDGASGETITMTAGVGFTVLGTATLVYLQQKRFLIEFTNVTSGAVAANMYSLGTVVF